ncbi:hypothetical protein F2Q69_00029690 [Brassica cretica]|uniref:RNase H type-1 domain-containing protein n=1 Tax=Brassica cretica TaxID=69181 RepID=A0A8S9S1G5_BRACR|nr:hypothetical protein F2Q69_00029690 [Brassica cretica]
MNLSQRAEDYVGSLLIAEALAIRLALMEAQNMGINDVHVNSDLQVLIRVIQKKELIKELVGILQDIYELSCLFFLHFAIFMAILAIFSPSLGDLIFTTRSGVNFQKENILAANKIKTGNFQNLFGNYQRSSENIRFSYKSSKENSVYLGFLTPPSRPLIPLSTWRSARTVEVIFLLVMDANLVEKQAGASRQHHNNLAETLMPLLAPSVPPGLQPYSTVVAPEVFEQLRIYMSCVEPYSTVVAPEVFEQLRIYMSCVDPEERSLREAKMKKTLDELSRDTLAQRSCFRLETAPVTSMEKNGERGRVFDFRGVENREIPDISESSARRENRQHPALEMGSEYNNQQKEGTYAIGFRTEQATERSVRLNATT